VTQFEQFIGQSLGIDPEYFIRVKAPAQPCAPVHGGAGSLIACIPPCDNPSALTTLNITHDEADFGWTSANPGATFTVEYGPSGFTQGTGIFINGTVGVDGPPVSVGGLTPATAYDWYITEDCSLSTSNIMGPETF